MIVLLNKLPKDVLNLIYFKLHTHYLCELNKEYHSKMHFSTTFLKFEENYSYNGKSINWRCLPNDYVYIYKLNGNPINDVRLPARYSYSKPK